MNIISLAGDRKGPGQPKPPVKMGSDSEIEVYEENRRRLRMMASQLRAMKREKKQNRIMKLFPVKRPKDLRKLRARIKKSDAYRLGLVNSLLHLLKVNVSN